MKIALTIVIFSIISLCLLFCGCSEILGSSVYIDGYWEIQNEYQNLVTVEIYSEAINAGDTRVKNVEAIITLSYGDSILTKERVFYGSVPVNGKVSKNTISNFRLTESQMSDILNNGVGNIKMEVSDIFIDGIRATT